MSAVPVSEDQWLLTRATVRGKAHLDNGLPNQDWVEVQTSADGRVVAAVVSDGAGTASQAHVGSRVTCELMVSWMCDIGHDMLRDRVDAKTAFDKVAEGIENVRRTLSATGGALRNHHCTLVACVLTDRGGYVCQVGDSIAVSTCFVDRDEAPPGHVDFFPDGRTRVFAVDRGEYANETHFITEPDWRTHLRVSYVANSHVDALVLMTDGAMDVAMVRGKVFRGFLSNLVGKLIAMEDRGERDDVLHAWLADRRTYPVTADDKTMFVAIGGRSRKLAGRAIYVDDERPEAPQTDGAKAPFREESAGAVPDSKSNEITLLGAGPALDSQAWYARPLVWMAGASVVLAGVAVGLAFMDGAPTSAAVGTASASITGQRPLASHQASDALQGARPTPTALPSPRQTAPVPPPVVPRSTTAVVAPSRTSIPASASVSAIAAPDAPSSPPAVAQGPVKLVFMPQREIELVLVAGASADVTLRMIGGAQVRLVDIRSSDGSGLRAKPGTPPCAAAVELTAALSTCVISVEADKKTPLGLHNVSVVFNDLQTGKKDTLSLAVRLVPAAAR